MLCNQLSSPSCSLDLVLLLFPVCHSTLVAYEYDNINQWCHQFINSENSANGTWGDSSSIPAPDYCYIQHTSCTYFFSCVPKILVCYNNM